MGNKKFFLDSKGVCFLCLRDNNAVSADYNGLNGESGLNENNVFSLHTISNFLDLNWRLRFNPTNGHAGQSSKPVYQPLSDVIVPICEECSTLTDTFTELYTVLEDTRARINDCLQSLCDVIGESGGDSRRVEEMKRRMCNGGASEAKSNLLEKLRTEVKNKGIEKIASAPARTLGQDQFDQYTDSEESINSGATNTTPNSVPLSPASQHSRKRKAPVIPRVDPAERPVVPSPSSNQTKSDSQNPATSSPCSYCNAPISLKTLNSHLISHHLNHFFPTSKLPSITSEQYMKILDDHLFEDLANTNCPLCGKTWNLPDRPRLLTLKLHMVKRHNDEMVKKLLRLQEDPIVLKRLLGEDEEDEEMTFEDAVAMEKITNIERDPEPDSGDDPLEISEVSTTSISNPFSVPGPFDIFYVPQSGDDMSPAAASESSVACICPFCSKILSSRSSLPIHLLSMHCEHYFKDLHPSSLSLVQFQDLISKVLLPLFIVDDEKCSICLKVYSYADESIGRLHLKLHLVREHKPLVEERLRDLLQDESVIHELKMTSGVPKPFRCDECGGEMSSKSALKVHKEFYCVNKQRTYKVCEKCGEAIEQTPYQLFKHRRLCLEGRTLRQRKPKRKAQHQSITDTDNLDIDIFQEAMVVKPENEDEDNFELFFGTMEEEAGGHFLTFAE